MVKSAGTYALTVDTVRTCQCGHPGCLGSELRTANSANKLCVGSGMKRVGVAHDRLLRTVDT